MGVPERAQPLSLFCALALEVAQRLSVKKKTESLGVGLRSANRSIRQTRIRTPERVREKLRFALVRTGLRSSQPFG